jgi:hypothetical protein
MTPAELDLLLEVRLVTTQLLVEVHGFLGRFVAYPSPEARVAHALWVAHAHLMDVWESTPRIAFLSPEPGSGKTRALEITETLVPRPIEAVNVTPAYLFRRVADPEGMPTILYDEIDTVFGPRAKRDNEEIRGFLNAGHRRGAMAGRCVVKGRTVVTEELPAFCAVAMAGIGNIPDTMLSRSVVIRMRRRAPTEIVEPYRRRIHSPVGNALRDRLTAWAEEMRQSSAAVEVPAMPDGVADRDADVWEALIAVAAMAGPEWAARARGAALLLVRQAKDSSPSLGVRLLSDLRNIFGDREMLSTEAILKALTGLEEAPWGDLKGKPLNDRGLANYLRAYGVRSKSVRVGLDVARGYARADLHDPWVRYLPPVESCSGSVADVADVTGTGAAQRPEGSGCEGSPMGGKLLVADVSVSRESNRGGLLLCSPQAVTSTTSATECLRCGGEGCSWCTHQ